MLKTSLALACTLTCGNLWASASLGLPLPPALSGLPGQENEQLIEPVLPVRPAYEPLAFHGRCRNGSGQLLPTVEHLAVDFLPYLPLVLGAGTGLPLQAPVSPPQSPQTRNPFNQNTNPNYAVPQDIAEIQQHSTNIEAILKDLEAQSGLGS